MFVNPVQVPIGQTGLAIVCDLNEEKIAICRSPFFDPPIIELSENKSGVDAWFLGDSVFMKTDDTTEEYAYSVLIDYKSQPLLLAWLKQQKLQNPFNV